MIDRMILLIEDSSEDALLIRRRLQTHMQRPFQITHRKTMAEAEQHLQENPAGIGLILLDLHLPDTEDPKDSFRRVKRLARGIPVIILTGMEDYDLAIALMKEGAEDFVGKNLAHERPELLRKTLDFALCRHRVMREINEKAHETLQQKDMVISWMSGDYSVQAQDLERRS